MRAAATALVMALGAVSSAHPVELEYFWAATCSDCAMMNTFLDSLSTDFPELTVNHREVAYSSENHRLMAATAQAHGLRRYGTPMVVVGNVVTTGVGLAVETQIREEVARLTAAARPTAPRIAQIAAPAPLAVPWTMILLALAAALVAVALLGL